MEPRADAVTPPVGESDDADSPAAPALVRWAAATAREGAWAPLLVIAAHVAAVFAFDAYHRLPRIDLVMHFAGGVAVALFFDRASVNGSRFGLLGPFHVVTHALLVGSLVCVAAFVWEVLEFASDQALGTRYQPSLTDTMTDLLLGNFGGAAYLLATAPRLSGEPPP